MISFFCVLAYALYIGFRKKNEVNRPNGANYAIFAKLAQNLIRLFGSKPTT